MRIRQIVLGFGLVGLATAFGQFTPISTPDATYTGSTTAMAITAANSASAGTVLTDSTQTLTFSSTMTAATAAATGFGGWATWGSAPNTEGKPVKVVYPTSLGLALTITLTRPVTTFGFELEPNNNPAFSTTVTFLNGSTTLGTITRSPIGASGALLFAATTTTPITSVTISIASGSGGFALGRLRSANVAPAPMVTSVTPSSGPPAGGNTVTITGTNFTGATSVTFGGTAATSFTVVSATTITATVPAGSAGAASVIVTGPGGSNSANSFYQYLMPVPTLSEWGMIGLAALLILYGCVQLRGRREMGGIA